MRECPNCGDKDFSQDHKGSYSKEHCDKCKGGSMAKPNSKAPLGQGGRFAALAQKTSPAIAASIGMKKYGKAKMQKMAKAGKKAAKMQPKNMMMGY